MWNKVLNIFRSKGTTQKHGFGIMEVMVSILVLGFMYAALNQLQKSNDEAVHRLRCRDGAVQVAQEIMDELKKKGAAALPSASAEEPVYPHAEVTREWERGLGGKIVVSYTPTITILEDLVAESRSNYETSVQHVYAKKVDVKLEWKFKGSTQSMNISGIIR